MLIGSDSVNFGLSVRLLEPVLNRDASNYVIDHYDNIIVQNDITMDINVVHVINLCSIRCSYTSLCYICSVLRKFPCDFLAKFQSIFQ